MNLRFGGSKVFSYLAVALVVLLIFQLNAQFLHEHNLIERGYTLIHVEPWNLQELPDQMKFSRNGQQFYNTALCETHFQINALKQIQELGFLLLFFLGLVVFLGISGPSATYLPKNQFLPHLYRRAPPVLP